VAGKRAKEAPRPPPRVRFVRARRKDAARFLAMEREIDIPRLYCPAASLAAAAAEIGRNRLYLLWFGGRRVGTVAFRRQTGGTVEISNLAIRPAWRGRGFARAALLFVLKRNAAAAGFVLVTHPENEAALTLYRSLGFKPRRRFENFFGDGEPRLALVRASERSVRRPHN
jgi:ribosomal protein S18 acetylase RimI-like enzyme